MDAPAIEDSIVALGFQLFNFKLYWVACSSLWIYDYFLTCSDEFEYGILISEVFWIFFLNRYLAPCFIIITLFAYFSNAWTSEICTRYGFMETLETVILTTTAELLIALRVYAITKKSKIFPCITGAILSGQWAIALYSMSQSSKGTDQVALLLPRDLPPLPPLPDIDPYHVCIFISVLTLVPFIKAFLSLALAFDTMACMVTIYVTVKSSRSYHVIPLLKIIQRDGIMYFLVLFSSNLVWVLLLIYAPPAYQFIHNQPAMIISSIMINRITLNLKMASQKKLVMAWGVQTFTLETDPQKIDSGVELATLRAWSGGATSGAGTMSFSD